MGLMFKAVETFMDKTAKGGNVKAERLEEYRNPAPVTDLSWIGKRGIFLKKSSFMDHRIFRISAKSAVSDKVVVFFCGGGGLAYPSNRHFRLAKALVQKMECEVIVVSYPKAPKYTMDDAYAWGMMFYEDLIIDHRPQNITLMGDEIGAMLAVNIAAATENKPNGVIMISPAQGLASADDRMAAMYDRDLVQGEEITKLIKEAWISKLEEEDPLGDLTQMDFTVCPPVQLFYGTEEIYAPYMPDVKQVIAKAGIRADIREGAGLSHGWPMLTMTGEGADALKRMCRFIVNSADPKLYK